MFSWRNKKIIYRILSYLDLCDLNIFESCSYKDMLSMVAGKNLSHLIALDNMSIKIKDLSYFCAKTFSSQISFARHFCLSTHSIRYIKKKIKVWLQNVSVHHFS